MCGRFTQFQSPEAVAIEYNLDEVPELTPRYNISPTQQISIVTAIPDSKKRHLEQIQWGLQYEWSKTPMFNARSETILEKRMFKGLARKRRCLIPADGFYEWKKVGKQKHPIHFSLKTGGLFAFAGIWAGQEHGCCLITCEPNDLVAPVHDRMPAMLPKDRYSDWLQEGLSDEEIMALLKPFSAELMTAVEVSQKVNSSRVDNADLLEPAETAV